MGDWLPIREPRAQRSDGPSERSALTRSQATFFGDFLFCQKRKLPSAGKALTPQTTKETAQSQKNRKRSDQNSSVSSYDFFSKKCFLRKLRMHDKLSNQ
ncbi:hypothetical protein IWX87_001079 [Polaromonas sp. CG_9.7]|uniref:hypothetical protein n=1 Tax=Polaromonas sp. CG_9.7 TaxID=2787732 RepID=UPI001A1DD1C2|nr:hypothetical protein [Polaromonas sp. CG_9.7]MBG6071326.1 hypothetical protein [Polaromonas sp. CG_9.7]